MPFHAAIHGLLHSNICPFASENMAFYAAALKVYKSFIRCNHNMNIIANT